MKRFFLASLLVFLFLAVPAQAVTLTGSLTDQLTQARAEMASDQDSLSFSRSQKRSLRALQAQAIRLAPRVASQLKAARARTKASENKLNRITLQYIDLVQSLGGSPAASTDQQRFLNYLSEVRADDAVLIIQQGKGMLDRQEKMMDKVRFSAEQLKADQLRTAQAAERQDLVSFQATQAVTDNNQRIKQLTNQLADDRSQVAQLEARLGILASAEGGSVLTAGQVMFAYYLAELSGLDVNLIKGWVLAEMSGSYATGRQSEGNHNWLNIGYFDSLGGDGAFQSVAQVWSNPQQAARASAAFLEGHFLGASPGIQRIILSSGGSVEKQIRAIATSGWASSGYGGGSSLRGTYKLVPKTSQPSRLKVRWKNPRDNKTYLLGDHR